MQAPRLSGLCGGGEGAEAARAPRTPTTGGEGGFVLALEHCDLYFLLACWREGVIVRLAPSLGLLTEYHPLSLERPSWVLSWGKTMVC